MIMTRSNFKDRCKAVLVSLSLLACGAGFGWLVRQNVLNFLEGKTSVAVTFRHEEYHTMPLVVFCSRHPFHRNATWQLYFTRRDYESLLRPPLLVRFGQLATDNFEEYLNGASWRPLDTMYNGRCLGFNFDLGGSHHIPTGGFLHFDMHSAEEEDTVDVYFIQPGEEIFLLWQNWYFSIPSVQHVDSSCVLGLHLTRTRYLDDCSGGDDPAALSGCFLGIMREEMGHLHCLPMQVKSFLETEQKECQEGDEELAQEGLMLSSILLDQVKLRCKKACVEDRYEVAVTPYTPIKGGPYEGSGGFQIYVQFPSPVETIREQYLIHDAVSIVSAIGGGLGLFLGFSCLTVLTKALRLLLDDAHFWN